MENMPPMMPHSRTRNCHSGMCCSLTVTIRELVSYFTKMPETPWLPAAWFITRSLATDSIKFTTPSRCTHSFLILSVSHYLFLIFLVTSWVSVFKFYVLLTRSVTENWCVSADILCVFNLVGTTVMKYWNIWLSGIGSHSKGTMKILNILCF